MTKFQERLTELYEELRDSDYKTGRTAFAKHCGITRGQLDGYLKGGCDPLWNTLLTIAKKNNVTVSWLLGESNQRCVPKHELCPMLLGLPEDDVIKVEEYIEFLRYKKLHEK